MPELGKPAEQIMDILAEQMQAARAAGNTQENRVQAIKDLAKRVARADARGFFTPEEVHIGVTDDRTYIEEVPRTSILIDLSKLRWTKSPEERRELIREELVGLSAEEKASRLENNLTRLQDTANQAYEVGILAVDLAPTRPDLSKRAVTDYVESRIKMGHPGLPAYFLEAEVAIPVLSALGDSEEIRRRVTSEYIEKYINWGMDAKYESEVTLEGVKEVVYSATRINPQLTVDIVRVLLDGEDRLGRVNDARHAQYRRKMLSPDAPFYDTNEHDARYYYVVGGILTLAGRLAVMTGDKKLGQEALKLLSAYKRFINEDGYYFLGEYGQAKGNSSLKDEFSRVLNELTNFVSSNK